MDQEDKRIQSFNKVKIPLERHRRRWKANIKTDLKETGHESVDWTQDRSSDG